LVLAASVVLVLLMGCKEGSEGPPGPKLQGTLIGFVRLVDVAGTFQADASAVTVSIAGTNVSATSDALGKFVLNNVETGTYEVIYSKTAYGTLRRQGISFASGGSASLGRVDLGQIPNYTVTTITGATVAGQTITINANVNTVPANQVHRFVVFLGTTNDVSGNDPQKYRGYKTAQVNAGGTTFNVQWTVAELSAIGVISANTPTLSFVAYGYNQFATDYTDLNTNRAVLPSLSQTASNVFSGNTP
jgi:hypothetical protein